VTVGREEVGGRRTVGGGKICRVDVGLLTVDLVIVLEGTLHIVHAVVLEHVFRIRI
jgi:hypothetical protein